MIIAIDGPAGAGKSTISRLIASCYGWTYLDTGAMYRTVTLMALKDGIAANNGRLLGELSQSLDISFEPGPEGVPRVFADGVEVTDAIRSQEVSGSVSEVSAHREVREALVAKQRRLTTAGNAVADGRDIGTVVCPGAEVKIFLTASMPERARRRRLELEDKGVTVPPAQMEKEITARDDYDSSREVSPLKAAPDAVTIDTTDMSIDEVMERVAGIIETARVLPLGEEG